MYTHHIDIYLMMIPWAGWTNFVVFFLPPLPDSKSLQANSTSPGLCQRMAAMAKSNSEGALGSLDDGEGKHPRYQQGKCTPIAGWFIAWKILEKMDDLAVPPWLRKTQCAGCRIWPYVDVLFYDSARWSLTGCIHAWMTWAMTALEFSWFLRAMSCSVWWPEREGFPINRYEMIWSSGRFSFLKWKHCGTFLCICIWSMLIMLMLPELWYHLDGFANYFWCWPGIRGNAILFEWYVYTLWQ